MDKETLSNYGWIVICVLVLAVMLALATPFGTFVADGFKATYTGLFETGDSALDVGLNAVGVSNKLPCGHGRKESGDHSQKECGHFACNDCGCTPASCGVEGHWSGDGLDHTTVVNHTTYKYKTPHTYACQCESWAIPEGGTYTTASGTVYNSGEQLPCGYSSNRTGDKYYFEDYIYTANTYMDGWGVDVVDKSKSSYSPVLGFINGLRISSLGATYRDCTNLVNAPDISACIELEQMGYTFERCTSLINAPVIPEGVFFIHSTFNGCKSLAGTISVPCSASNVDYAVSGTSATLEFYHVDGCDGSCGK